MKIDFNYYLLQSQVSNLFTTPISLRLEIVENRDRDRGIAIFFLLTTNAILLFKMPDILAYVRKLNFWMKVQPDSSPNVTGLMQVAYFTGTVR